MGLRDHELEPGRGRGRPADRPERRGPRAGARTPVTRPLRSARWFAGHDLAGLHPPRVAHARGLLARRRSTGGPVVGHLQLAGRSSSTATCTSAASPRRSSAACCAAGGLPLEFPTISLGENLMKPTSMLFRNLMAMDVEESIRAYPLDAVVLLGGCDKTVPAQLMGARQRRRARDHAHRRPGRAGVFRGRELGAGTDLWHYTDERARRPDDPAPSTTSSRRRRASRRRPLQRDGHRLDDGRARRGARDVAAGHGGDPRGRRARRAAAAEATGRARGRARADGPRPSRDPDRGRVRQRDHAC